MAVVSKICIDCSSRLQRTSICIIQTHDAFASDAIATALALKSGPLDRGLSKIGLLSSRPSAQAQSIPTKRPKLRINHHNLINS